MLWFEGSISDAIQSSKMKRSLFIVYIYGEDDASSQMNATWESDVVSGLCQSTGAVAIRIQANSQDCRNFSQYYPVVVVPSTFFIGELGVPLEVTGGHVTPEEFFQKFENVLKLHAEQKSKTPAPASSGEGTASGSGEITPEGATAASAPEEPKPSPVPLEEKVQRAKTLIEQKRKEREEKEKEKEKKAEEERRRLGQDLQKLKQQQQEMEMKELRDQMKKDKEAERLARERTKELIAKDREERKARDQKRKDEKAREMEERKKAKLMEEQKRAQEYEARRSETARIQVKFPDGSSSPFTYPSSEPLQNLMNDVQQRTQKAVRLSTSYPKHNFTPEEMSMSFMELQLAPSAVVLAVWDHGGGRVSTSDWSWITLIFSPFLWLWNFIATLLFGGSNRPAGNQGQQQQQQTSSQSSAYRSQGGSASYSQQDRPKTAVRRRTGNTGRLADLRDDDDDMTTYNGNSTQQL